MVAEDEAFVRLMVSLGRSPELPSKICGESPGSCPELPDRFRAVPEAFNTSFARRLYYYNFNRNNDMQSDDSYEQSDPS